MVKIIQDAIDSATKVEVPKRVARMHLFADSAEGMRVQVNKEVATERALAVMRRVMKTA